MQITAPCVASLVWRLEDAHGNLIDELTEPVEFFVGGDDLLPKVEEALVGQAAGYRIKLHLEPEHAFGDYDSALVFFEDRALFAEPVEPGMRIEGVPEGARTADMPTELIYMITEVYPSHVVLDGNHPLAGMALRLDLTVKDVRGATDEEIAQRSVDAPAFTVMHTAAPGPHLH